MKLIERDEFLKSLQARLELVVAGEGHCVLITGEAGMGKTTLVKTFLQGGKKGCATYWGTCDALFTPRPLAPVYEIFYQLKAELLEQTVTISERSALFTAVLHALGGRKKLSIVVIEDIHWADEATLDFVKFLARRIDRLPCLLILTYRDDEIHMQHPLRNVIGQLQPDFFSRIQLTPLSRQAVEQLASEKGYKGEDVFTISGGNPFYVNEILASYSHGVPDNIKDSVLSVYNSLDLETRTILQLLSVLPTGIEMDYLKMISVPESEAISRCEAIHRCLDLKILVPKNGFILFKHELYRRTIENSLSPFLRIALNRQILEYLKGAFEQKMEIERIIHHAKNANAYEVVVHYAPIAARQAASVGSHIEATKLYQTAIDYYQEKDKDILLQFYESYAYECYLTNQIREAIIYTTKSLKLWQEMERVEKTGNCLRFLSRLWWFQGVGKKAEDYAIQAVRILEDQPASKAKAMAFSTMSQLKMLAQQKEECISWAARALALAKELKDSEVFCHALINVGTIELRTHSSLKRGRALIRKSLKMALKHQFDDHAARAYANLVNNAVKMKDYTAAASALEQGLQYCEERDLDCYGLYLLVDKARMNFERGNWEYALRMAEDIVGNGTNPPVTRIDALVVVATIRMRRGEEQVLPLLLEAQQIAIKTGESQRIIPVMSALLEYEWITGETAVKEDDICKATGMLQSYGLMHQQSEFAFWLFRSRNRKLVLPHFFEGYNTDTKPAAEKAALLWQQMGCPFEEALARSAGSDVDKRKAMDIMQHLQAKAVYKKIAFQMRSSGIKNIPRGKQKSTRSNAAHLTQREIDVLQLLKEGLQNKEIAGRLYISAKTVDHHISSILFKLSVNSRVKAVQEALQLDILK